MNRPRLPPCMQCPLRPRTLPLPTLILSPDPPCPLPAAAECETRVSEAEADAQFAREERDSCAASLPICNGQRTSLQATLTTCQGNLLNAQRECRLGGTACARSLGAACVGSL